MNLKDFHFDLPLSAIARFPLEERSASRLLCVDGSRKNRSHKQFRDIITFINPGDLLIFNDTKVIPARLLGHKKTGGQVEVLVERLIDPQQLLAQLRASKAPHPGDYLFFPDNVVLEVIKRDGQFYLLRHVPGENETRGLLAAIEAIGHIPLPHYMQREADEIDAARYQTIYAKHKGSVAAPTAGLHFDDDLMAALKTKYIETAYLTLHIGAGTFAPVRVENIKEHQMHAEYFEISPETVALVHATKARGNKVIAVGTTTLRALESASVTGALQPYCGDTQIFIYPGYQFNCVDALITNLHLPASTLLMLVCAFGGHAEIMAAYQEAVLQRYRFYSYGDAMWVVKNCCLDGTSGGM